MTNLRTSAFTFGCALAAAACTANVSSPSTSSFAQHVCPPPTAFANAVCACGDLTHAGELHVLPGSAGTGSVGVNGATRLVGNAEIVGTLTAWGGLLAVGASIGDSLITPAGAQFTGDATIGHDATIGGDLEATGTFTVNGTLAVGGSELIVGDSKIASRGNYTAPAAPPCGCDPSTLFDVAGAVAAAAQAAGGQTSWDHVGTSEVHLATGTYYVTSAEIIGENTIYVDGNVSIYVDGSLEQVGSQQWQIAAGASLDLFVSGTVQTIGSTQFGNASNPDAFRLYLGGSGEVSMNAVGMTEIDGSIYAPLASLNYIGDTTINGAVFGNTIEGTGQLTINYGTSTTPPSSCGGDGVTIM